MSTRKRNAGLPVKKPHDDTEGEPRDRYAEIGLAADEQPSPGQVRHP
jgi:hypothetical protein